MSTHAYTMARSVSLSDEAFAVLRRDKQPGESDSDVVLRLHRTAQRKEKDPMSFFRNPPKPEWTPQEYERVRESSRQLDIERARKRYGYKPREDR